MRTFSFYQPFSEKDLENYIIYNSSETLYHNGLDDIYPPPRFLFNQVNLGPNYGIIDILTLTITSGNFHFVIYELKVDTLGMPTLNQAMRYKRGLLDHFHHLIPIAHMKIKICLIGKRLPLDSPLNYYLNEPFTLSSINAYTFQHTDFGISFKSQNTAENIIESAKMMGDQVPKSTTTYITESIKALEELFLGYQPEGANFKYMNLNGKTY